MLNRDAKASDEAHCHSKKRKKSFDASEQNESDETPQTHGALPLLDTSPPQVIPTPTATKFPPKIIYPKITTLHLGCRPRCCHRSILIEPYLVLFGGEDKTSYFDDIYVFNTFTHQWTKPLVCPRNKPIARTQHAIVYRKRTHSLVVLYGYAESGHLDDVYECTLRPHPTLWTWKHVPCHGVKSPALCGHTCTYHEATDSILMFGGGRDGFYSMAVFILSMSTRTWSICNLYMHPTPSLPHASMCQQDVDEIDICELQPWRSTLSGSSLSTQSYALPQSSIMHEYPNDAQKQSRLLPPLIAPGRGRHTAVLYNDNELYVFGGRETLAGTMSDCWRYLIDTQRWECIEPHGDAPSGRSNHDAVLVGHNMLVYGGDVTDRNIYSLNLKTHVWSKIACDALPRWGHSTTCALVGRKLHFFSIAGCHGMDTNFIEDMHLVELPLPCELGNMWNMRQLMLKNTAFADCVVHTSPQTSTAPHNHTAVVFGGTARDECRASTKTQQCGLKRKHIEPCQSFTELFDDAFGFDSLGEESSSESHDTLNSVHRPLKKQRISAGMLLGGSQDAPKRRRLQ